MPTEHPGLTKLVEKAVGLIHEVDQTYRRPAVLWSGGKDSTVMLHVLMMHAGLRWPVVQFRDPWFPRKWSWARWLAERWDLEVHDFPPMQQLVYEQDGKVALVSRYHVGGGQVLDMPKDVIEPDENVPAEEQLPSICGLIDFLGRPVGDCDWPFDAILIGHKDADRDPILGKIPLLSDRALLPGDGADAYFPMREWTDADIWDYTAVHDVPVDEHRYTKEGRASLAHNASNNDVLPACVRCMDRRPGAEDQVPCPKLGGRLVTNQWKRMPWLETLVAGYFEAERPPQPAAQG